MHGTCPFSPIISVQFEFLKLLSSLYLGPSHVNRKQYAFELEVSLEVSGNFNIIIILFVYTILLTNGKKEFSLALFFFYSGLEFLLDFNTLKQILKQIHVFL